MTGVISLQNLDHEDAFSESDVRLLTTLAGSLSVALENARLFDETKRLLADSTSAPPSWRSSTASSRASPHELDMQAMYYLVGDKIAEIFDAQVVQIGLYDLAAGTAHYPYTIEKGVRFAVRAIGPIGRSRAGASPREARCCSPTWTRAGQLELGQAAVRGERPNRSSSPR